MYLSGFSRKGELTGCWQQERDFKELAHVMVGPPECAERVSELEPQAGLLLWEPQSVL